MQFDGAKLRAALDTSVHSITEIAHRAGVSRKALYLYMDGTKPSADALARIAQALGRELDFFYSNRSAN